MLAMSSPPSARELKKSMLVMRASLERQEWVDQVTDLRGSLGVPRIIREFGPGLLAQRLLPIVFRLAWRHPALSGLASVLAVRAPLLARGLRLAGIGLVVWRGWKWFQRVRSQRI